MATNLMISYPRIPQDALTITSSQTEDEDYQVYNLIGGPRHHLFQTSAAAASLDLTFDLGIGTDGAEDTDTVDHVIIGRADLLQSGGVTSVALKSSDDNFTASTTEQTFSDFDITTLRGPREFDFISTFTETSAHRYWRLSYTATSTKFPHSFAYFGKAFDFGDEPNAITLNIKDRVEKTVTSKSGKEWYLRTMEPMYEIQVTWRGITDSVVNDFMDRIGSRWNKFPIYLYTTSSHDILEGYRLMCCKFKAAPVTRQIYDDYNEVSLSLMEAIG